MFAAKEDVVTKVVRLHTEGEQTTTVSAETVPQDGWVKGDARVVLYPTTAVAVTAAKVFVRPLACFNHELWGVASGTLPLRKVSVIYQFGRSIASQFYLELAGRIDLVGMWELAEVTRLNKMLKSVDNVGLPSSLSLSGK